MYTKVNNLVKHLTKFPFQAGTTASVIPLEVKAAENLQAKSLKFFVEKFRIPTAIRTSLSDFRRETWLINLPLYMLEYLRQYF
jgi:hypothetical protein